GGRTPGLERIMERYPLPLDDTTVGGQAMLSRQVVQYSPVFDNPAAPSATKQFARDFDFNSVIFAPMIRQDKVIGAIGTAHHESRVFCEKEVALIKAFADQAVIAIENVRLFDQVQARTEELDESPQHETAPADVSKVLSRSAFDLQAVLDTLVESAARLCEAQTANIFRPKDGFYEIVASYGFSSAHYEYMQRHPIPISPGTVTGQAALE